LIARHLSRGGWLGDEFAAARCQRVELQAGGADVEVGMHGAAEQERA